MKQPQSLKPKSNADRRLRVINRWTRKVREAQKWSRVRDEQRRIRKRFQEVWKQCDELKHGTEMIMKQTADAQLELALMFNILSCRKAGDFTRAAKLSHILREIVAKENENTNVSLDAVKNEVQHKTDQ